MVAIRVTQQSDMPIYRQIAAQLTALIETGGLVDGERLPSSRLLADNLHVNRNTVAHAYATLRDAGLVESRRRNGMVVIGGKRARSSSVARDRARAALESAARECSELGLSATQIQALAVNATIRAEHDRVSVSFVECNADRAAYFAEELEQHLGLTVTPLVLGELDPATVHPDLVLTTFFHLAEVRALLRRPRTDVVAIVVAPHVQTLVQIAQVPSDRTVGIWYSTQDQALSIRDSLAQSGITNIRVLQDAADDELTDLDLVVIPSEMPQLKQRLEGRVRVIEFGNVLDAASIRMVADVVRDLQAARTR
ncbi:GntR family transcriptional regulator [Aeromicrobium stalagmiti]|uniref:GntR family transcriptional regulator n=1 Tax=Aeromicrobium stalagmiti TaxID=2738988 RepID=UPI00156A0C9A|nr:GntR family transcriptional regulator [Aeromicrobium stalagmiti]NRQ49611.1 GntR family transcriptional regulator [Aeromicrobium stalagmiti]